MKGAKIEDDRTSRPSRSRLRSFGAGSTSAREVGRLARWKAGSMSRVHLFETWLRVELDAQGDADFHLRWLRHNCDLDLHPATRERTVCSSELPDDLRATHADIEGDALVVRWAHDGRESRYALRWLREHAYAPNRTEPTIPSDVQAITLLGGSDLPATAARALSLLRDHGAVVVRRAPDATTPPEDETEAIVDALCSEGLRVIGTHFGRIEDLRTDNTTNANTDQLGYTNAAVDLHTDQPFLEAPPRLQLLQSIRRAERGGESYLVDARAAADVLAAHDAHARELLERTPVRFHRKQRHFEKTLDAPLLNGTEASFQVRWSYFTLAPYRLPFATMEAWYRAHDRFARLVRDPRNQLRFTLAPGDFVLYDNHRMLHARSAFQGARWVRGVYFDR